MSGAVATSPTKTDRPEGGKLPAGRSLVFARAGKAFATSRDVADFFGKRHANVLRDIDVLRGHSSDLSYGPAIFTEIEEPNPVVAGRTDRSFEMSRDGFMLLAMGFTGAKAMRWKIIYIAAFNAMEAELRSRAAAPKPLDLDDAAALRRRLLEYTEGTLALKAEVAELAPKAEAWARIAETDGLILVTNFAKEVGIGPRRGHVIERAG